MSTRKQLHLDECHSTQEILKEHLPDLAKSGDSLVISTSKQTQGHGREGREWWLIKGSLAFSYTASSHPQLTWQSLEVAVLLQEFIEKQTGIALRLKWPNDIYDHAGKKVGGILLNYFEPIMIIGVGLNLLPSVQREVGSVFSNEEYYSDVLLSQWPKMFCHFYDANRLSASEIKAKWEVHCAHLGKEVSVDEKGQLLQGFFMGLGEHGEALIQTDEGEKKIYNGTLRF